MNLFILALTMHESARQYCDEHVGKIIAEVVQCLFSVHWHLANLNENDNDDIDKAAQAVVVVQQTKEQEQEIGKTSDWVAQASAWMLEKVPEHLQPPQKNPYKMRYKGHPWFNFMCLSSQHYQWCIDMGFELSKEFQRRRGHWHRSASWLPWLRNNVPLPLISSLGNVRENGIMMFPIAMPLDVIPVDIRHKYDLTCEIDRKCVRVTLEEAVECYRVYYLVKKCTFATWKWNKGKVPEWFMVGLQQQGLKPKQCVNKVDAKQELNADNNDNNCAQGSVDTKNEMEFINSLDKYEFKRKVVVSNHNNNDIDDGNNGKKIKMI